MEDLETSNSLSSKAVSAYPGETDLGWRRRLRSRVLRWYDNHGRRLPWRESADAYRIWVSEIMLQQTTVAAVVPYFERFLQHFPDVQSLANAQQEQVLRQWEGLGYYSRARNLHKAAGVIVDELNGEFPQTADELQKLPGVGPYTAGAIASFAFNEPAAILEANTLRLYSRLIRLETDPRGTAGQKKLWKFAGWIVSRKRAADFNQAVMDIGSQVCRPTDPDCPHCPLLASCKGLEAGRQHDIPLAKAKPTITDVVEVSVAIRKGNRFLLRQRSETERWAGLWDFVRFEITDKVAKHIQMPARRRTSGRKATAQKTLFDDSHGPQLVPLPDAVSQQIASETGAVVTHYEPHSEIKHSVTRYRIRLLCLVADCVGGRVHSHSGYRWVNQKELQNLPLSTTGRRFADMLCD